MLEDPETARRPSRRQRLIYASDNWRTCIGWTLCLAFLAIIAGLVLVSIHTREMEELEVRLTALNTRLLSIVGATGATGATGVAGVNGTAGSAGANGTAIPLDYADFYALMPGDNAATVGLGVAVQFPQDGPTSAGGITRLSASTFQLAAIGTYQVLWQVSVTEAGQLVLGINGVEQLPTAVGRATGTSQIVGLCYITTAATNRVLNVLNPAGNSAALTITVIAGGALSVSAHLVITRVA